MAAYQAAQTADDVAARGNIPSFEGLLRPAIS
jgi:hypothetical protein